MYANARVRAHLDQWCLHSYYSLNPYAPDGSERLLLSSCDVDTRIGHVHIADKDGNITHTFGENGTSSSFFHTGYWQTWSPDAKFVYYQGGSNTHPLIIKHNVETGEEISVEGDMEGAPPFGEPITSGLMGMLYASGYGDGVYSPEKSPRPFQARDQHGLFRYVPTTGKTELVLSVEEILQNHPDRDRLMKEDQAIKRLYGENDGLTLMAYCLRWSRDGKHCLFHFGNHCTNNVRKEPRIGYVFTADRDFKEMHMVVDMSFGRRGVHWSLQPNGDKLIGYGPRPDDPTKHALAFVNFDGSDYHIVSDHATGGHSSVSPADPNLIVTDDTRFRMGKVEFLDARNGKVVDSYEFERQNVDKPPYGRNPYRVCHHPVFNADGTKVLFNTLPGKNAELVEIDVKGL